MLDLRDPLRTGISILTSNADGSLKGLGKKKSSISSSSRHDLTKVTSFFPFTPTGHMEFLLKLPQFSHLRDVSNMPESICPCSSEAVKIIKELIDQIVAAHPRSKYIHIGCDEVYHLGECEDCQGGGRNSIFVSHVQVVAQYVKRVHRKQPIIWDDMLR